MKSIFYGKSAKFAYFSFIFIIITTAMYTFWTKEFSWWYIVINDILAVIPLFMAMLCEHFHSKKKTLPAVLFGFLWLLFFPNSPYMITDYKYIASYSDKLFFDFQHNNLNISAWLLILNLTVCVALGILYGMMSLRIVHRLINQRFGKGLGIAFCTVSIILSSFAIYIGRYARVNSWDIVRPLFLIEKSLNSFSPFTPTFILLFTIVTGMLYAIYYAFDRWVIRH